MMIHNSSYSISNSYLKINTNKTVTNQAINKRRKNTDISLFDELNDKLLDKIYIPHKNVKSDKGRMIAVDASQINLNKELHKDGFKLSKSGNYCVAKLGSLYDITNKIPINYQLSKSFNERQILIEQLKYVNKYDTLIMDGGYYSADLINILIDREINFIFRLRCNNALIKKHNINEIFYFVPTNTDANNNNDKNKSIQCKIVKFEKKIDNKKEWVYLLTNLITHRPKTLTDEFWSRWTVETDFRKIKYDIMYEKIRSKSEKQVMIDIKILNFIGIVSAQLENFGKPKAGYKINTKNALELFHTHLIHLFIYKKMTKNVMSQVTSIMKIIVSTVEKIRKRRTFPRRRITPSTKWNVNGNRYGPG